MTDTASPQQLTNPGQPLDAPPQPLSRAMRALAGLTLAVPLALLPMAGFKDRTNYLRYGDASRNILDAFTDQGILGTLANEPLWLALNTLLSVVMAPELVVRSIILIGAFIFTFSLTAKCRQHDALILIGLFFLPLILKNYVTHLRQGLAIAVFVASWTLTTHSRSKTVGLVAAALIHSSFWPLLALQLLRLALRRARLPPHLRLAAAALASIVLVVSLQAIAAFLGARQVQDYAFAGLQGTGRGFLLWLGILLLFLGSGREWIRNHEFAINVLILYAVSYPALDFANRMLESGLPLVLRAGIQLPGSGRWIFLTWVIALAAFLWFQIAHGIDYF